MQKPSTNVSPSTTKMTAYPSVFSECSRHSRSLKRQFVPDPTAVVACAKNIQQFKRKQCDLDLVLFVFYFLKFLEIKKKIITQSGL